MAGSYLMLGAQGQQVAGDSRETAHKGWIELNSVSLPGAGNTYGDSSGATGKMKNDQITVSKMTDTSSPTLFAACADGRHFETAVIDMWAGKLQLVLSDVVVASFNVSPGVDSHSESVTLRFATSKRTTPGP